MATENGSLTDDYSDPGLFYTRKDSTFRKHLESNSQMESSDERVDAHQLYRPARMSHSKLSYNYLLALEPHYYNLDCLSLVIKYN